MSEYRIDDLARAAGMSVRNVRVYQERGLLPAPRREGRAAWYTDGHLARLELIARMLERGYTFATIDELLTAAQEGMRVTDLLGTPGPPRPSGAWGKLRSAAKVSMAELRRLFGEDPSTDSIRRTARLGALADAVAGDDGFTVAHPELLHAAAELTEAGVPLEDLLNLAEQVQSDMHDIARRFVGIVADHYLGAPGGERPLTLDADEVAQVADLINRLRPRANQVLQVLLAESMDVEIGKALQRAADQLGAPAPRAEPAPDAGTVTQDTQS